MTTIDEHGEVLVVRRILPFAPAQVFAAWIDPVSMAKWMRPGTTSSATVELDARVGGKFRIVMVHALGSTAHWGEYLAIEPPSLLSFTWISENTNFEATIVTVELNGCKDDTELVLTHRRLPGAQIDSHRRGWADIAQRLEEHLAE